GRRSAAKTPPRKEKTEGAQGKRRSSAGATVLVFFVVPYLSSEPGYLIVSCKPCNFVEIVLISPIEARGQVVLDARDRYNRQFRTPIQIQSLGQRSFSDETFTAVFAADSADVPWSHCRRGRAECHAGTHRRSQKSIQGRHGRG